MTIRQESHKILLPRSHTSASSLIPFRCWRRWLDRALIESVQVFDFSLQELRAESRRRYRTIAALGIDSPINKAALNWRVSVCHLWVLRRSCGAQCRLRRAISQKVSRGSYFLVWTRSRRWGRKVESAVGATANKASAACYLSRY
jgi:hypothetical protein